MELWVTCAFAAAPLPAPVADPSYHLLVADASGFVARVDSLGIEHGRWQVPLPEVTGVAWDGVDGGGFWVSSAVPTEPFLKLALDGTVLEMVWFDPYYDTHIPRENRGLEVLSPKGYTKGLCSVATTTVESLHCVWYEPGQAYPDQFLSAGLLNEIGVDPLFLSGFWSVDYPQDRYDRSLFLTEAWFTRDTSIAGLDGFRLEDDMITLGDVDSELYGIAVLDDHTFWVVLAEGLLLHVDQAGVQIESLWPPGDAPLDLSRMPADL